MSAKSIYHAAVRFDAVLKAGGKFWAEVHYGCALAEKIEYPFPLSHQDIRA